LFVALDPEHGERSSCSLAFRASFDTSDIVGPVRPLIRLLSVTAALGTAFVVRAQQPPQTPAWPRYYVGLGVGISESHLGPNWDSVGVPELIKPTGSRDSDERGWKALAGWRPLRVVGAEIDYLDFGEAVSEDGRSPNSSAANGYYYLKSRANATVLTAALFIPDGSPSFDVYGKLGVAWLEESFVVSVHEFSPECRLPPPALGIQPLCLFDSQGSQTDSRPYVGIGARFKIASEWAVRVEYDAIDGDAADDTTMFSLGIGWEG
jgi:outer membrane protein with beta-barrel domain